ncbi:hypothetical protein Tco_1446708 [Tanacetum coccineum]
MSRTNYHAEIVSEEHSFHMLRTCHQEDNQRVTHIHHGSPITMLRFVVEILRHHKLYNLVSLTTTVPIIYLHQTVLQMPPPDPNNTYIQPPSEIQILEFIKTLGYDEDPETKLIAVSKMVATRLHQPWRAILSVLNRYLLINLNEFEWQTVERSSRPSKMSKLLYTRFTKLIIDYLLSLNKSIPRRSDSKLHSSQDDHPITKLLNTTNGDYKFGMEVPDAMISDAIKKKTGYKYYMAKKVNEEGGEKAKIVYELEEQQISNQKWKSKSSDKPKGSANETDDVDESDMDLSDDIPVRLFDDARSHDNQDPPNNHEGENKKERRKDVGESSSRSSRQNRSPMVIIQDDTPAMQPLDKANILIQKHSKPEWFPKKSGLAKRRTAWFDIFLKSDIDKDENHILGPSTIAIAKKFKELIQKDELTIADFEGTGLERLKVQYNNDGELEYHVCQLKAVVLSEA